CLDVPGSRFELGVRIQLWTCNNSLAQRWYWVDMRIKPSANLNLRLDVPNSNYSNGVQLQLWQCNDTDAQIWWELPAPAETSARAQGGVSTQSYPTQSYTTAVRQDAETGQAPTDWWWLDDSGSVVTAAVGGHNGSWLGAGRTRIAGSLLHEVPNQASALGA